MDTFGIVVIALALAVGLALGCVIGLLWARSRALDQPALAALTDRSIEQAKVTEGLARLGDQLRDLEHSRVSWQGQFNASVGYMRESTEALRRETSALSSALRKPQVRGRWGELHLQRAVELAGLTEHCDFTTQAAHRGPSHDDPRAGKLRPDLVVHLAGGRHIVIDSKVPLDAFLDAHACDSEEDRDRHLLRHVAQLKSHITALASKRYWEALDHAPEFVVLFLPAEAFLAGAIDREPALIEYAAERQVIVATPSTLIALLRTIAQGWSHQQLAEQASEVQRLGRELHHRLHTMSESFGKLGRALTTAVAAYNQTVGSYESRVLVSARRFQELGVTDQTLSAPEPVELATHPAARRLTGS